MSQWGLSPLTHFVIFGYTCFITCRIWDLCDVCLMSRTAIKELSLVFGSDAKKPQFMEEEVYEQLHENYF